MSERPKEDLKVHLKVYLGKKIGLNKEGRGREDKEEREEEEEDDEEEEGRYKYVLQLLIHK